MCEVEGLALGAMPGGHAGDLAVGESGDEGGRGGHGVASPARRLAISRWKSSIVRRFLLCLRLVGGAGIGSCGNSARAATILGRCSRIASTLAGDSRCSRRSAIRRAMSAAVSCGQNRSSPARRSCRFSSSKRTISCLYSLMGESRAGFSAARLFAGDGRLAPIAPDRAWMVEQEAFICRQRLSPSFNLGAVFPAIEQALAVALIERVEAGLPQPIAEDCVVARTARPIGVRLDHRMMPADLDCFPDGEPIFPRSPRLQPRPRFLAATDDLIWVGRSNPARNAGLILGGG